MRDLSINIRIRHNERFGVSGVILAVVAVAGLLAWFFSRAVDDVFPD